MGQGAETSITEASGLPEGHGGGMAGVTSENKEGRTEMTDLVGNTVSVPLPQDMNHFIITSYMESFGAAIMLGQLDKVSGMCDTSRYGWLRYAFPEIADIPDYGSFDKVNMEELLQAAPDVVIAPSASVKTNEKMRKMGLTVLVDGLNINDRKILC